jgi:hypothetical protein
MLLLVESSGKHILNCIIFTLIDFLGLRLLLETLCIYCFLVALGIIAVILLLGAEHFLIL